MVELLKWHLWNGNCICGDLDLQCCLEDGIFMIVIYIVFPCLTSLIEWFGFTGGGVHNVDLG